MRTEIGSEFWSIPTDSSDNIVFSENVKWFASGRSALQAIIAENKFKEVSLPEWCCESMIVPFLKNGISVSFYDALNPPKSFSSDAILVMDYFGYSSDKTYEDYDGVVIRDITHSLFSKRYHDADYYFGSLRKWSAFYGGGFAWGFKEEIHYDDGCEAYCDIRQDAISQKQLFITDQSQSKEYLRMFSKAEELLDGIGIVKSCERDIELAKKLDVEFIKNAHRNNAKVLLDAFSDIALFPNPKPYDCPMFVPILVKDRDNLHKWLIQNEIYFPIHWPKTEYHVLSDKTKRIFDEEISLVCDQRYTEKDMQRIVDTIKQFWKEGK